MTEPDDDVRANLRHLCDECVNLLRQVIVPAPFTVNGVAIDVDPDRVALDRHAKFRVRVAVTILKELGCPPG